MIEESKTVSALGVCLVLAIIVLLAINNNNAPSPPTATSPASDTARETARTDIDDLYDRVQRLDSDEPSTQAKVSRAALGYDVDQRVRNGEDRRQVIRGIINIAKVQRQLRDEEKSDPEPPSLICGGVYSTSPPCP